ncbi:MAG: hypothetical protein OEL20_17885 [Sulfuritalea sp.]|nr:hypothetical protein [Sulfuritalea sp.]
MTTETAQQEFDRLCNEMKLPVPTRMISRESAEKLTPEWFKYRNFDRAKLMSMIDVRDRMPPGTAGAVAGSHSNANAAATIWAASNAKLIESRGGRHGQL